MAASPLAIWQDLVSPARADLRAAAAACDPRQVSQLDALRRRWPADLVHAALQLHEARGRAASKFGHLAPELIADPQALQQATSAAVALHKARRFLRALGPGATVYDCCCGMGGDALALHAMGLHVLAIDLDPLRAWMTQLNARCQTRVADVTQLDLAALDHTATGRPALHIDPARRADGRRLWRADELLPPLDAVARMIDQAPSAAVKLGPGVDPSDLPWACELEYVSENGQMVQAVAWSGQLKESPCRATRITWRSDPREAQVQTLTGPDDRSAPPALGPLGRFVYSVDDAIERARLLGELGRQLRLSMPHPSLGLYTSDERIESPWLTAFEVLERLPWRPERVKARLNERGAGVVEVKTRDKACDPEIAQKQLRGSGREPFCVFVLRWDRAVTALICRRVG